MHGGRCEDTTEARLEDWLAAQLPGDHGFVLDCLDIMLVYTMPEDAKQAAVDDIDAALRDGPLAVLPGVRFPLDETAAARDAVQAAVGKVLLDLARFASRATAPGPHQYVPHIDNLRYFAPSGPRRGSPHEKELHDRFTSHFHARGGD